MAWAEFEANPDGARSDAGLAADLPWIRDTTDDVTTAWAAERSWAWLTRHSSSSRSSSVGWGAPPELIAVSVVPIGSSPWGVLAATASTRAQRLETLRRAETLDPRHGSLAAFAS